MVSERHHSSSRGGYVLVMTITLLAIVATLLAGVARRSTGAAAQANRETEALKRRWAMRSVTRTLLPQSERLLGKANDGAAAPKPHLVETLEMNGNTLHFAIMDEQAKLHAGSLFYRRGREGTRQTIGELTAGAVRGTSVRVRPFEKALQRRRQLTSARDGDPANNGRVDGNADPFDEAGDGDDDQNAQDDRRPRAFGSFGQLFVSPEPDRLLRFSGDKLSGPAAALTCWGSGKLNYRRAPAAAIKHQLTPPLTLSEVQQLLELRREKDDLPLSEAIARLQPDEAARRKLDDLLTDGSRAHALWQRLEMEARSHDRLDVAVRKKNDGKEQLRISTFIW